MFFSIKDNYRMAVESASGGKNTVMYDNKGYPSIMVCIPKFNVEDIDPSLGSGTHPAFIVGNKEVPEIWIGKYIATVADGRAYSLPGLDPTCSINYTDSFNACAAKGTGWHLMTASEQAAIALWCLKNDFQPRGNTSFGKSHEATHEHGTVTYTYNDNGTVRDGRTATGSGPISWNHDNSSAGIADLCGNVWEWRHGYKIVNGKIYLVGSDNVPKNNFTTVYTEGSNTGWIDTGFYFNALKISKTAPAAGTADGAFTSIVPASGVTVPNYCYQMGITPVTNATLSSRINGDHFWINYSGERVAFVCGSWYDGACAGLFACGLDHASSSPYHHVGFRLAYISQ